MPEFQTTYLTGEVKFKPVTYHVEFRVVSDGIRWSWRTWRFEPKTAIEYGIVPDDEGLMALWGFDSYYDAELMMIVAQMPRAVRT